MDNPLYIQEILHMVSQGLKYPTMFLLAALIIYALGSIAALVVEGIVERRHFKLSVPCFLAEVDAAAYGQLPAVIDASGLLLAQRNALKTLVAYGYLPEADRVALARKLLAEVEARYHKTTSRNDFVAKVAPMLGLMGTLIPLGPGIVALGQGQTDLLASSIEIAFHTTVAGLTVAAIALFSARLRKRWYEEYLGAIDAGMNAILVKCAECEAAGVDMGSKERAEAAVAALAPKKRRTRAKQQGR